MIKKLNKFLIVSLAILLVFSGMPITNVAQAATPTKANENQAYEIYPNPQKVTYTGGEFVIRSKANVVYDSTIDEATKKRVKEVFDAKNVTLTETKEAVNGATNILIGTHDSGEYVDTYFAENVDVNTDVFSEINPHILSVDNGTIAILGDDTDAAFYGVTTLKHILEQIEGKTIRNLFVEDYADTKIRGFIEGYYGIPWSDEDRISLMEFGGDFKMTTYVFAPKDDPYHNSRWREPYPEERLAEIKKMVDAGRDSKVNFAWTIHPFMSNGINENNYDESMKAIITKFEQLYDIGVRQFGVLADDAGAVSSETVVRILQDLAAWGDEKGDIYDFLTVPGGYNTSWVSDWSEQGELSTHDRGFPDNVQIMWTGDTVVGHITQQTLDTFKTRGKAEGAEPRRDPVIWLNWPVNDINMNRLMMGKGEMLNPGVKGLAGTVTNPMQDAEASKVSLFAVADYTWNLNDFDEDQSWEDSFKYIDADATDALHTLAKHMSDPAPNGHGLVLGESEEIKPLLEEFTTKLNAGESVKAIGATLIDEFEEIIQAAEEFLARSKNEKLKEEIAPYAGSLTDLVQANIAFIQTAIAIEDNNSDALWANYVKGTSFLDASKKHDRPLINNRIGKAIPGSKRLVPFAEKLKETVATEVEKVLGSDKLTMKAISNYGQGDIWQGKLENLTDGDDNTNVWFNRYIKAGDYVGVEFSEPIDIKGLQILQGKNASDKDAFYYGKFQYFDLETNEWKDTTGKSYGAYTNDVEEYNLNVKTDKVRFIVDADKGIKGDDETNPKWAAFREFKVFTEGKENTEPLDASVIRSKEWSIYQGSEDAKNFFDDNLSTGVWYNTGAGDIAKEGSYFGLDLGEEIQLGKITIDLGAPGNANDKFESFDLEYSLDGETYTKYKSYQGDASIRENLTNEDIFARYVRVVNKKAVNKWVGFRTFNVERANLSGRKAYTNSNDIELEMSLGSDRFELLPAKNVTLKDGEYIGLKLGRIHDLDELLVDISTDKLQLQISKNEYEWINVEDANDLASARYMRLLNTTGADVTFDIREFVATSTEIEAAHIAETNFTGLQSSTAGKEFDGDLTTSMVIQGHQAKGKYIIYDLGQEIDLDSFEIYLHDSSLDFIYDGIVSLSTDKENWEEFLTIGDQEPNPNPNGNINDSYPNHKVSYNTIDKRDIGKRARYIKIEITQNVSRWVQFNEIMINDGEYFKVDNDVRFETTVIEERGGAAPNLIDGDLSTMYIPSEKNGSLKYHISDNNGAQTLTILQSENTISNAAVKARIASKDNPGKSEVVTIGHLSQSLNRFQLPNDSLVYDIEIAWGDVIPNLYELTLTTGEVEDVNKAELVEAMKKEANKDWTTSSKEAYAKALTLAKEINENEYASQQSVDSAMSGLENAYNNAALKGDAKALQAVVDKAKENAEELYTSSSWNKLASAIKDAETKLKDEDNLSVEHVMVATERINTAVAGLTYEVVSKEDAVVAVEDAKAFIASIENPAKVYTEASYEAFSKALDATLALIAKDQTEAVVPTKFKEATTKLHAAEENLVDAAALYILLDEYTDVYEANEGLYTPDSFADYTTAIDEAKETVKNGTKKQVQETAEKIENARGALMLADGSTALIQLIESYNNYEAKDYTTESFAAFSTVLEEAKALVIAGNATAKENEAMSNKLVAAGNDLVSIKELNGKLNQAEKIDENLYTEDSYNALTATLQKVENDKVTVNGDKEAVQDAINAIKQAIEELVRKADTDAVNELIAEMDVIHLADYTNESAKAVEKVLSELQAFVNNPNAAAKEFATLQAKAMEAKEGLVSVKALKTVLDQANAFNADDYTKASFEKLATAIKQAESLLENGTTESIVQAINTVNQAMDNLVKADALETAKKAVTKAGETLNKEDLATAKKLVNALPDSSEKDELLNQLAMIEELIKEAAEGNGNDGNKPGINPGDNNNDNEETGKGEQESGSKLPATATNTGNFLWIGFVLVGLSLVLTTSRRVRKSNR